MKKLFLILALVFSASSFALNEGLSNMDLIKLSADADVQLQSLDRYFQAEMGRIGEPATHDEGRVIAALRDMIQRSITEMTNTLFPHHHITEDDLRNIDFQALQIQLDETRILVDELIVD